MSGDARVRGLRRLVAGCLVVGLVVGFAVGEQKEPAAAAAEAPMPGAVEAQPVPEPKPVAVMSTGYVITAPANWKTVQDVKRDRLKLLSPDGHANLLIQSFQRKPDKFTQEHITKIESQLETTFVGQGYKKVGESTRILNGRTIRMKYFKLTQDDLKIDFLQLYTTDPGYYFIGSGACPVAEGEKTLPVFVTRMASLKPAPKPALP